MTTFCRVPPPPFYPSPPPLPLNQCPRPPSPPPPPFPTPTPAAAAAAAAQLPPPDFDDVTWGEGYRRFCIIGRRQFLRRVRNLIPPPPPAFEGRSDSALQSIRLELSRHLAEAFSQFIEALTSIESTSQESRRTVSAPPPSPSPPLHAREDPSFQFAAPIYQNNGTSLSQTSASSTTRRTTSAPFRAPTPRRNLPFRLLAPEEVTFPVPSAPMRDPIPRPLPPSAIRNVTLPPPPPPPRLPPPRTRAPAPRPPFPPVAPEAATLPRPRFPPPRPRVPSPSSLLLPVYAPLSAPIDPSTVSSTSPHSSTFPNSNSSSTTTTTTTALIAGEPLYGNDEISLLDLHQSLLPPPGSSWRNPAPFASRADESYRRFDCWAEMVYLLERFETVKGLGIN